MRVVIPCWDYSDYLNVTLPAWRQLFPRTELTVVTTFEDEPTIAVARRHDAKVFCTTAWLDDGATINKAAAVDAALGLTTESTKQKHTDSDVIRPPVEDEVMICVDADCYPRGTLQMMTQLVLDRNTIYGCKRYQVSSVTELRDVCRHRTEPDMLKEVDMRPGSRMRNSQHGKSMEVMCGYFQAWLHADGIRMGSYPTCAEYDVQHSLRFAYGVVLDPWMFHVVHLGVPRMDWAGRKSPGVTA